MSLADSGVSPRKDRNLRARTYRTSWSTVQPNDEGIIDLLHVWFEHPEHHFTFHLAFGRFVCDGQQSSVHLALKLSVRGFNRFETEHAERFHSRQYSAVEHHGGLEAGRSVGRSVGRVCKSLVRKDDSFTWHSKSLVKMS